MPILQRYGAAVIAFGWWRQVSLAVYFGCCNIGSTMSGNLTSSILTLDGEELDVVLVKIGGSSLTHKATQETINEQSLEWVSRTIVSSIDASFLAASDDSAKTEVNQSLKRKRAFVVVHGAGSFGHHTAKKYDLQGRFDPPTSSSAFSGALLSCQERRRTMQGLAKTRLSVQTLNRRLVESLVRHGVNAVGISPCFAVPQLQAHGGGDSPEATQETQSSLERIVRDALQAGLVPVLHGDACLYGRQEAGILSGDVVMERLGLAPWVTHAIFLTDVAGVFESDPRLDPNAGLLRFIQIDKKSLEVVSPVLDASGSSHEHDVTGGLQRKLASAAAIAASGINVTIAECGTLNGEKVMLGVRTNIEATTVYSV